jgi:hypothetical protein
MSVCFQFFSKTVSGMFSTLKDALPTFDDAGDSDEAKNRLSAAADPAARQYSSLTSLLPTPSAPVAPDGFFSAVTATVAKNGRVLQRNLETSLKFAPINQEVRTTI